ncbi:MAG: tRNA 2-thiouridine(34) synthase MnmA [Defluviitaleaceae bacterium]|nr:tRNA 2-thiouridine(34) synthase MnmA [Defluviitaleaceae bacterium]
MAYKILTAMSGGVDSSVAAYLLRQQGHTQIGAMMKLYTDEDIPINHRNKGCCSLDDAEDARAVATAMDIPFFVFNFADSFQKEIMDRFVAAYKSGRTPNPCIDCNRFMKFERFIARALEMDCSHIATGHYARIEQHGSRFLLKKGLDHSKDQSYVLYAMTQPQLSRTLLPLGSLTKDEVRKIAEAQNLATAKKRDSQDICFAPDGDYAGFIERHTGAASPPGDFISSSGQKLGRHKGIDHYTIGQRKGLGISAPHPLFVVSLNPEENTVTLGQSEELFSNRLTATDVNLIATDKIQGKLNIQAKIRYAHQPTPAILWQTDTDKIEIEFPAPQRAITPGQAVVLYDGDIVIGGGTIV